MGLLLRHVDQCHRCVCQLSPQENRCRSRAEVAPHGTRQCAIAQLIRKMPSKSIHRIFVSEAGPCGYWLYRSLTHKGPVYWGVAPSWSPTTPRDRVKTHRRDAIKLARLKRSGDLTPVDVPTGDDRRQSGPVPGASEAIRARKTATFRLKPFSCGTLAVTQAESPAAAGPGYHAKGRQAAPAGPGAAATRNF